MFTQFPPAKRLLIVKLRFGSDVQELSDKKERADGRIKINRLSSAGCDSEANVTIITVSDEEYMRCDARPCLVILASGKGC